MTKPPGITDTSDAMSYMKAFHQLVRILRQECPWDRKQTHESISHLLIEETYETVEAIRSGDRTELARELGDLLLHVVMHAVIAEQQGSFTLRDVIHYEFEKLVNRHPHVFGTVTADSDRAVMKNWEALKQTEGRSGVLNGVPATLPAALRAQRVQDKAANAGFDWHDKEDVWAKVNEELEELREELKGGSRARIEAEFGDVFFALINAARHEGVIAETAITGTVDRFTARFKFIEASAAQKGRPLTSLSLEQMDELWDAAKAAGL